MKPEVKKFWEEVIFKHIYNRKFEGYETISILDVGCGVGTQLYAMCAESVRNGLRTDGKAIDLVQSNVSEAKRKMSKLLNVSAKIITSDVKTNFPGGAFDLITFFELVHWLKPKDVQNLLNKASKHSNKGALILISYATKLNNALLRDENGNLDIKRSFGTSPIESYSHACKTDMTFFSKENLVDMGTKSGLKFLHYEQLNNPFFPTSSELGISFSRDTESTEGGIIGFLK